MKPLKIITIVGVRPQFIKAAAVSRAITKYNKSGSRPLIQELYIHTGQHYDYEMSKVFFQELKLLPKAAYHLGVGSGSQGFQTGEILKKTEGVLIKEKPDVVLVYGDANSTLAGALTAAKIQIPIAHIEAGLRSFNRQMPEEINRLVADHLSAWLFCPSEQAVKNLAKEGIRDGVHLVGDVMYEMLLLYLAKVQKEQKHLLARYNLVSKSYALVTVHRAENTDEPLKLRSIFSALKRLAREKILVAIPLHPRTKKALKLAKISLEGISVLPPVSYKEMLCLETNAKIILTDSGGIQKEAYWFSVPCLTLREETEWVETLKTGWNRLVGSNSDKILRAASKIPSLKSHPPLYSNNQAAEKIVHYLSQSKL